MPSPESSFLYEIISGRELSFVNTSENITQQVQYEWDFDDNLSSSIPNPTHTFSSDGTYNVALSLTDQCGESQSSQEVIIETTSVIEDSMSSKISIYPIPTANSITIRSSIELNIRIVDSFTRTVHRDSHNGKDDIIVSLKNYPQGTYYLSLIHI